MARKAKNRSGPPRILHLHSTFDAGGKELRCVQLMNAFGKGVEHSIVSADPLALGAIDLIKPEIMAIFPRFPSLRGKPTPGRLRKLAEAMKGFDLILTYNWGAMDAVMAHTLFAKAWGLPPLVHHEDGFNQDEAVRLKTSRNWYRRIALGRAAALIVPSRKLEQVALDVWYQPRARVHRIPNGIATKRYARAARRDVMPTLVKHKEEHWIGTLAGLRKVKNLERLIAIVAEMPEFWQLVILGEGPERAALQAEAERLGAEHRVHLPGFVEDPAKVIGLFDIFALSSDSEQFPVSVLEAMAAGLPVAAPDVGDIKQMVVEENHAFITPAGDQAALRSAIIALSRDPAARTKLGAANRYKAAAQFDEKRMIERYRALYGSLIGRGKLG